MVNKKKRRHGNDAIEPEKENDEVGVADYELSREQRIKENLERMQKLGIIELSRNLKPPPKPKTIRPQKRLPLLLTSQRRSSRIQTLPTVDYSEKRIPNSKEKVMQDVKIEIKEGSQPEVYTEEHEKALGDHKEAWTLFVDGYDDEGNCINDEVGVEAYELSPEQKIKENLERKHTLGILELSQNSISPLKPKTIGPQKPLPPLPSSLRRSSRIQTIPTVDYSEMCVQAIKGVKSDIKTCHQCRQKTAGHLTKCCKCEIGKGQFCGDCLFMRYGENVLEAKENPNWVCPVCRDICNCNRCRRVKGWKPTGNIYKKVLRLGFKSVAHYLIHTRGPKGKLDDMDNKTPYEEDSKSDGLNDDDAADDDNDNDNNEDGSSCENN